MYITTVALQQAIDTLRNFPLRHRNRNPHLTVVNRCEIITRIFFITLSIPIADGAFIIMAHLHRSFLNLHAHHLLSYLIFSACLVQDAPLKLQFVLLLIPSFFFGFTFRNVLPDSVMIAIQYICNTWYYRIYLYHAIPIESGSAPA
mgnify:CR=1 FL=1